MKTMSDFVSIFGSASFLLEFSQISRGNLHWNKKFIGSWWKYFTTYPVADEKSFVLTLS